MTLPLTLDLTCSAGGDYDPETVNVIFQPSNESSVVECIDIFINDDSKLEGDKFFTVGCP